MRLGARHHLAAPAARVVDIARGMVGLHSSDPVSVMLGVRARSTALTAADVEHALYEERSVARILGMRRTMFVVPTDFAPTVHGATTRALAPRERRRFLGMLAEAGIAKKPESWLRRVERKTMAALQVRGEATAVELTTDVPELAARIHVGAGTKWEGTIGVSTRVLFLLATDGKIIRGRPRGSWTSTQYRWAPTADYLGVDMEAVPADEARVALARCWLARFGPGLFSDLQWWTGWTVAHTRQALAAIQPKEVDLGGATGLVLADDDETAAAPEHWVALLPTLDPTVMGWKSREWYLGPHKEALFDRNGNAGHTIWCNGRIVGGWAQLPDGEIATRLLEDLGGEARAAVDAEADAVSRWCGDMRFVPRFRTPLERELSASARP